MEELAPARFDTILALVPPPAVAGHMAFVHAVLEGSLPGFVLVDRAAAPASAVVCNLTGFWFALGQPDEAFAADAVPELLSRVPEVGTALWAPSREWERLLSGHFASKRWRTEFHYRPAAAAPAPPVPPGLTLAPIDASIAARFDAGLDPWVIEIFGGPAEFSRRSFGFALLKDGQPVAFCAACAVQERGPDREIEIEIGTAPAYRERLLGTIVGQVFIEECVRRHFFPAWTCGADNVPSERLAIGLGFAPARKVAGFGLRQGMAQAGGLWL